MIDADTVIQAIGTSPNPLLVRLLEGAATGRKGNLVVDEDGRTSLPRVYAGGDIATGAATVILAMGAGKRAAAAIDADLRGRGARPDPCAATRARFFPGISAVSALSHGPRSSTGLTLSERTVPSLWQKLLCYWPW